MIPIEPSRIALALAGGALIGTSASILLLTHGRIAGISGMVGNVLQSGPAKARPDALPFLAGLLVAGLLSLVVAPEAVGTPVIGPIGLVVAGLFVGFGTRLGSGCTSGHGVCGISRFSFRSIAATLTFMATGAVAIFIVRHVLHLGGA